MNQKSYSFLLCSLLMASYTVYGMNKISDSLENPLAYLDENNDDNISMKRENTASPSELQQDQDNHEWSQKYAKKIVKYFFNRDYEQITEKELANYLKNNPRIATDSLYVDNSYMLGVVNGLLEKYEFEHKVAIIAKNIAESGKITKVTNWRVVQSVASNLFGNTSKIFIKFREMSEEDRNQVMDSINDMLSGHTVVKNKMFNDDIKRIVNSFKKEGKEKIAGFSEVLQKAKDLNLSKDFISQLENLSDREKGNLFLMIDMMLPTKAEVANALELSRATHIEDQKQESRKRELDIRRDEEERQKEHREISRALDLVNSIQAELKKYAIHNLKPSILKLIDRDVELSTVTNKNLGDIQDITKEELIDQARKDGLNNFLLKDLDLLDESDIHDLIHEVVMQDRIEKSLELARAADKNKKDGGSDSDMMKPGYESGSDNEDKDSVANALNLSKDVSKNKDSDEGMGERQDESEDFDDNDDKLSQGLFGNDDNIQGQGSVDLYPWKRNTEGNF